MKKLALLLFAALFVGLVHAQTVGVSWSNFQEERWKTDEAAMVAKIEELGGTYISADAQSSPEKQLNDIDSLIARGADVLIVLSQGLRRRRSRGRGRQGRGHPGDRL